MNWGFWISLLCTLGVGLVVGHWRGYDKGGRDERAYRRSHREDDQSFPELHRFEAATEVLTSTLPRRVPSANLPADLPDVEYSEVPTELLEQVRGGLSRWKVPRDVWERDYAGRPGRHHTDTATGTDAQRALTAEYEVIGEWTDDEVAPIFMAIGPLPVVPVFAEPNWPSLALEAVPA